MSRFEIRHTFDMNEDAFWNETFFDTEFNRTLYLERLGFARWEIEKEEELPDGSKTRRVRVEPKSEIPSALKKFVGEGLNYLEEGTWDPRKKRYTFRIEPSKMKDKI
ncbi:MAG: DUF2505 family protein, partial [Candidatus Latescibacteria bacterium]|nr:DUF2505 family protein [Candidatus Latescibacterota bacterium]